MENEFGQSSPIRDFKLDLDAAAAVIESRRGRWTASGFEVGDLTWRDVAAGWPYPLVARSEALAPDSVGVEAVRESVHVRIVLFDRNWEDRRGGYADVEGANLETGVIEVSAPDVPSIDAFGRLLDATFDRWSSE
jgi:hypothetical protein